MHETGLSSVADGLVIANATVAGPTAPLLRSSSSMDQGYRALRKDDAISFRPASKTIEIQNEEQSHRLIVPTSPILHQKKRASTANPPECQNPVEYKVPFILPDSLNFICRRSDFPSISFAPEFNMFQVKSNFIPIPI